MSVVIGLAWSCAHAPRHRAGLGIEEQVVATAVWWATRVPEPAREYLVRVPPALEALRILSKAASYADLVVAGPGVLRGRGTGLSDSVVRLTVEEPQWVTGEEVVVPFTHATGAAEATRCLVRIRMPSPDRNSWMYRGEGEEHCWPRPSPKP